MAQPAQAGRCRRAAVKVAFPDGTVMNSTDPGIDAALSRFLGQPVTLTAVPPPGAVLDRADPGASPARRYPRAGPGRDWTAWRCGPGGDVLRLRAGPPVTTSTLEQIAVLSPRGTAEQERYRPNIVIQTTGPGFPENDWVGRDLRIGRDLAVTVIARTPRCAIPTLEHGRLPRDPDALRVPASHNRVSPLDDVGPQPCAGVYAQVLRPGRIQVGDVASLA